MGTSTAYSGPNGGTPLIPTWLEGDEHTPTSQEAGPNTDNQPVQDGNKPVTLPDQSPIPKIADPKRFSGARSNFTRFAGSGGSDRASLGRAISNYVSKSAGGPRQAAQRMGASRSAGTRLLNFISNVQTKGIQEALRELNLESLAGRPVTEIFIGLADYICPGSGTVDEGIAREAYLETIVELANEGMTDLSTFSSEQMQTVFELYITHAIEARICNDIGTKAVMMPTDAKAAHRVEKQLRDFIQGGVSDALTRERENSPNLTIETIHKFVDAVYESAFSILRTLGDVEANK